MPGEKSHESVAEPQHLSSAKVVFLGWCEAADQKILFNSIPMLSIIGLSETRISHVFPLDLKNNIVVFAIFRPTPGERFEILVKSSQGSPAGVLHIGIQDALLLHADGSRTPVGPQDVPPHWALKPVTFPEKFLFNSPGRYELFHVTADEERIVGSFVLGHAPVPEFNSDTIAAIRSDPFATKLVRMQIGCEACTDNLKVYSGLERSPKLEREGFLRDTDLQDKFACGCGRTTVDLQYVKTGLRGLLLQKSTPMTQQNPDYIRLYEASMLEEKCRQFKKLLDDGGSEERLQDFLEKNPVFFSKFNPQKLMFKSSVLSFHKVDFAILNERKELVLVEIENSNTPLLKQDGGMRSELQHAVDQVRSWLQVFHDHRTAALAGLNLKLEDVAKVRGVIIAGRTPGDPERARSLRGFGWADIDFYTFDDILSNAVEITRHILPQASTEGET
jgi:antiviral defense system Shedu protein SduA